jgi:hypothetical protein
MLAALVAMWRLDLRPEGDERRLAEYMAIGEEIDGVWVEEFRTYFDRAAEWLTNEVFTTIGETDVPELVKAIMEFLNLPLWEQRDLLYEIWMLCATLDACEQAGWTVELNGLSQDNREWILSVGRSDTPVATLRHVRDPAVSLEVWREPSRKTESEKELTPDVTVSTPAPYVRDLLIVEAKDRQKMSVGLGPRDRAGSEVSGARTAIGVAERYAKGLRPRVVWVCNHCDFRQGVSAEANHGNAWTHIHVADQFRPGHVPGVFAESVRTALAPDPAPALAGQAAVVRAGGLVVVIDVTSSMRRRLDDALAILTSQSSAVPYDQFRAVLYSDHGNDEPLLVRKVGPFNSLPGLLDALKPLPAGSGGDTDEALEDAMQRCRELADDIGPIDLLVLTDAPPHSADKCPYGIDFESEVRAMLKAGCRIQVASDWWSGGQTWSTFRDTPGFRFARLRTLLS